MAALKRKKPTTKEARKIIRKALEPLQGQHASDTRIHRARKQIKKARATLRLLRKSQPRSRYRAENQHLRNASEPQSQAPDACVLLQTLDLLKAGSGRNKGALALRRQLIDERSLARAAIAGAYGLARARRLLHNAKAEASLWSLKRRGWSAVGPGLKSVYAQGRDALAVARRSRDDSHFHEWRKQSRYLRYQLHLMEPVWRGPLESRVKEVHSPADCLGDDHDLAVLRGKAEFSKGLRAEGQARDDLLTLIDARRRALQLQALDLGARLNSDPTTQFCQRLERHGHAWRRSDGNHDGR